MENAGEASVKHVVVVMLENKDPLVNGESMHAERQDYLAPDDE